MDKKEIKIPGYIWIIAVILVACILFLIFVQVPFSKQYPVYETNHNSAVSQIMVYEDYNSRADEVQKKINENKAKYIEESQKLFINAKTTSEDIRKMLKKLDYDLSTLTVSAGVEDAQGRTSSTGDPLYSTQINFAFNATYQKLLDTLDYFETQSDGSYYISSMVIAEANDKNSDSSKAASVASTSKNYTVQLTMNLYYFSPNLETASSVASTSSAA